MLAVLTVVVVPVTDKLPVIAKVPPVGVTALLAPTYVTTAACVGPVSYTHLTLPTSDLV